MRALVLAFALLALAACQLPTYTVVPVANATQAAVADTTAVAIEAAPLTTAAAAVPTIVAVRDAVQQVLPEPAAPAVPLLSPAAVELIVRWEVSSPAYYTRRLQSPLWPRGASGVTWGVGYDGGHQTRTTIGRDWHQHPAVERLQGTSGITGQAADPLARSMRDVRTPYAYAYEVFAEATVPVFHASARMTFGAAHFDALPLHVQGALVSVVYNRGPSMLGESRREMRAIRDLCLPNTDTACVATQLRSMCRLWVGTANGRGLCDRRADEARLAERAA